MKSESLGKKIAAGCWIFFILSPGFLFAQEEFMQSAGISCYRTNVSEYPFGLAITYSPRIIFKKLNDMTSLSAGTHFSVGAQFDENMNMRVDGFKLDLPLLAEINYGNGALKDIDDGLGCFGGFGYGVSNMVSENGSLMTGPVIDAGLRGWYDNNTFNPQTIDKENTFSCTLRLSYQVVNFNSLKGIIGLGFFINFDFPSSNAD